MDQNAFGTLAALAQGHAAATLGTDASKAFERQQSVAIVHGGVA
jgi:hypothetical protein